MTRSFIAVEITGGIKERIFKLSLELRALGLPVKTTIPENLHITLLFLGEVDNAFLAKAKTAMDEASTAVAPFSIVFRGAGGFPSNSRPSVLWAGTEDATDGLGALRDEIAGRLYAEEKDKAGKKFVPHVTVARVKRIIRPADGDELKAWIKRNKTSEFGEMTVRSLSLFESRLTGKGAVHTPLYRSALS